MKMVRNIAAALAAVGALSLGATALAQDAKKPEPQGKPEASHQHRGMNAMGGMNRMREMRGGCHGESRGASGGEHNHS